MSNIEDRATQIPVGTDTKELVPSFSIDGINRKHPIISVFAIQSAVHKTAASA